MFKRLFQHVCLIVAAAKEQTTYIYNFNVVQNHVKKKNSLGIVLNDLFTIPIGVCRTYRIPQQQQGSYVLSSYLTI